MKSILISTLLTMMVLLTSDSLVAAQGVPLKVGMVGLVHGHADGFLNGGGLTPAAIFTGMIRHGG